MGTVGTARVLCPRDCLASPPPTPHTAARHGRDAAPFCTHRSVGGRGLGAWPGVSSHAAGLQGRASPCACRLGGRRAARHLVPQGRPACASGGEPLCSGPWGPSPTRRPGQRPAGSSACHTSWQRLGCEPTPRTAPGLPAVDPRPGSCPGELRLGARALLTRQPVRRAWEPLRAALWAIRAPTVGPSTLMALGGPQVRNGTGPAAPRSGPCPPEPASTRGPAPASPALRAPWGGGSKAGISLAPTSPVSSHPAHACFRASGLDF